MKNKPNGFAIDTLVIASLFALIGCESPRTGPAAVAITDPIRLDDSLPLAIRVTNGIPQPTVVLAQYPNGGENAIPPRFLESDLIVTPDQIVGFRVINGVLVFELLIDGDKFPIAVARSNVQDDQFHEVMPRIADSLRHRWQLRPSRPITTNFGMIQVEVLFDDGRRSRNLGNELR